VQQRLRPRNRRRWVDWFHCRKEGGGGCRHRPTISALSRCHPAALRGEVYGTADGARISCRLAQPHREPAIPTATTERPDRYEKPPAELAGAAGSHKASTRRVPHYC